ncbi:MAG: bifunctional precorrin-2 dehydrogenase/sirohydrochlorin ferrochelatase [Methanoregula sp.]|jgi:precorrin-2 dehydrogenase/sirohydrochlorin ferrochelatase
MIPLFVDCSKKRIVIFGGGDVAARKAAYFAGEADVVMVSRSFSEKCSNHPVARQTLELTPASDATLREILAGSFLVIGALSDTAQNNRIKNICQEDGILFNNADGETGDVMIPAISQGKQYTFAFSTKGSSPAISRFIRTHIEKTYPGLDDMIELQNFLREQLKNGKTTQGERTIILNKVLEDKEIWDIITTDPARARNLVSARYLHD